MRYCNKCGNELSEANKFCIKCGQEVDAGMVSQQPPVQTMQQPSPQPQVIFTPRPSNGTGTAGFVLALIGLILSWIPIIGFIGWILLGIGLILSLIGVFFKPRGLAIAGLIISVIRLSMFIRNFTGFRGLADLGSFF